MESHFIKLLDHRARIIWTSDKDNFALNSKLAEFAVEEDRVSAEARLADAVLRGHRVEFISRWDSPRRGQVWSRTFLFPVELPGIAALSVNQLLPVCFNEFTDQDIEILRLLAADKGINEIAVEMDRSTSTIDGRVRGLKVRLEQKTLHGLISAAYRGSLLRLNPLEECYQAPRLAKKTGNLCEQVHDVE